MHLPTASLAAARPAGNRRRVVSGYRSPCACLPPVSEEPSQRERDPPGAVVYPWGVSHQPPDNAPDPNLRPRPQVPAKQRRYVGRPVADVHGRRQDAVLRAPRPELEPLVDWLTPAFYVDLGRPCNAACMYCAVPPHEDAQGFTPTSEAPGIIAAGQRAGCDRAILIGGEPTIHPQLDAILAMLRDAGLPDRHIVMTNGQKLAAEGYVQRLANAGVATLHISVDTVDSDVHDRIGRTTGRLARQLKGLDAALAHRDLQVYVYTAVTRLNAGGLTDLLEALAERTVGSGREAPLPWVLAVVKPIGDALRFADKLLLGPAEAAPLLRPLVARAQELGVPVGIRNVQACLAPDLVPWNVDYYLDDFSVEVATGERVGYSHNEYWFKPASCADCGHNAVCTGIYREVERRFGISAFVPVGRDRLK